MSAKSDSTPVELPASTGRDKQYRIVCAAPFYDYTFIWSKKAKSGYTTQYELDLPEETGFDDLVVVADCDVETKLRWHVDKYMTRIWRRNRDW
jgi:hypothetical protein